MSVAAAVAIHALILAAFGWIALHNYRKPAFAAPVSITATVDAPSTHSLEVPDIKPTQPDIEVKQTVTPPAATPPPFLASTISQETTPLQPETDDFGKDWPVKKTKPKPVIQPEPKPAKPRTKASVKTTPAQISHSVPPRYPSAARRAGIQGTAQVSLQIGSNGRVQSARIARSSGNASLDSAALIAARKWRFTAATRAGTPVNSTVIVPIRFTLR